MSRQKEKLVDKEDLFIGIDLHKQRWHVTIRTSDIEFSAPAFPGPGRLCSEYWLVTTATPGRRSMKPDILGSGFMTAWWRMASPAQ